MNTALTSQTADIQMIRDKTLPTDNWNRFSIIDIFIDVMLFLLQFIAAFWQLAQNSLA